MATKIYNVTDLQNMKNDLAGDYELANDIDASETETWNEDPGNPGTYFGFEPLGAFSGSFDGQGYAITALYINRPTWSSGGGLFSSISGATIRDVTLADVDIVMPQASYLGALIGRADYTHGNTITNCHSRGTVSGGRFGTGGLIGDIADETTTVSWCSSSCDVYSDSYDVGGLVGESDGDIFDSYATGNVTAARYNVGGLVGDNGGLVVRCYATGSVSGEYRVGGLAGRHQYIIEDSYATGNVIGSHYRVGGLVGDNRAWVRNSYARGSATAGEEVGGLVGRNQWEISNCYSTGAVSGSYTFGGLVGANTHDVINSFWNTQTSGQATSAGGTGKTTAEMKRYATFKNAGWDIGRTYRANPNDGYPFLSWQVGRSPVWLLTGGGGGWIPGPGPKPAPPAGIHGCQRKIMLGSGTQLDPHIIQDVDGLQAMKDDLSAYYELDNDIDGSATTGWNWNARREVFEGFRPIAHPGTGGKLTGGLDGKGYTVSDPYFTRSDSSLPIFGLLDGATIKNINSSDLDLNVSGTTIWASPIGSVDTDSLDNVIEHVHLTGSIKADWDNILGFMTGILAGATGHVRDCTTAVNVSGRTRCSGSIDYHDSPDCFMESCHGYGNVPGTRDRVAGFMESCQGHIRGCSSTGDVTAPEDCAAGFVGLLWETGLIDECSCTGDVKAHRGMGVSASDIWTTARNCCSRSNAQAISSWYEGGFAGYVGADRVVKNCFSAGTMVSTGTPGGFSHGHDGRFTDCFRDEEASGVPTSDGGEGKTTAEMKRHSTFDSAGWDIGYSSPHRNDGYPFLSWETGSSPVGLIYGVAAPATPSPGMKKPEVMTLPTTKASQ